MMLIISGVSSGVVTGVHDLDAYLHAQLLLAVSFDIPILHCLGRADWTCYPRILAHISTPTRP